MAKVRNLHWWTVEYGLIGDLDNPKIYGAGLLSSITESQECLQQEVLKIPYDLSTADVNFDITTAQPQLFVTPNFEHLNRVLEQFAATMAFQQGGLIGVQKVLESQKLATIELSSGLQISGTFTKVLTKENDPIYLQSTGPTSLSCGHQELDGHLHSYHQDGFGSPVGSIQGLNMPLEACSTADLVKIGILEGQKGEIVFTSGIQVQGELSSQTRTEDGKLLLLSFTNCTVTYQDQILFQPEWGMYDMAVGESVISCFAGPASYQSFEDGGELSSEKPTAIVYSDKQLTLHSYYQEVKDMRDSGQIDENRLLEIFTILKSDYSNDWLLSLEIYELLKDDLVLNYLKFFPKNLSIIEKD